MFALYHPDENEYVGIEITHDECNVPHDILTPYSGLNDSEPYLFASKTPKEAQSILDVAKNVYEDEVPPEAFIMEYLCDIPNIADYIVVELLPSLPSK